MPLHFVFLGLCFPFSSVALSLLQDFPYRVRAGTSDAVEGLSLPLMGDKTRGRCRQAGSLGVSELPAEGDKAGSLGGRTSQAPTVGLGRARPCLSAPGGRGLHAFPQTPGPGPLAAVCVQPGWLRPGLVLEPRAWFNQKGHWGPLHPLHPSAAQSWMLGFRCSSDMRVCVCMCVSACDATWGTLPNCPASLGPLSLRWGRALLPGGCQEGRACDTTPRAVSTPSH